MEPNEEEIKNISNALERLTQNLQFRSAHYEDLVLPNRSEVEKAVEKFINQHN